MKIEVRTKEECIKRGTEIIRQILPGSNIDPLMYLPEDIFGKVFVILDNNDFSENKVYNVVFDEILYSIPGTFLKKVVENGI